MDFVDVTVIAVIKYMQESSHNSFKPDLGYEMTLPLVNQRFLQSLSWANRLAMHFAGVKAVAVATKPAAAIDRPNQQLQRQLCKIRQAAEMKDTKTVSLCCMHQTCLYAVYAQAAHECDSFF